MFNSKIRQSAYILGTVATGLITLLSLWNGMSGEAATALSNAITALLGLLGVGATATATVAVTKQRRDGVFDQSQSSPAEQAISGIQATIEQAQSVASDIERIKSAAADAVGVVPVIGPLARQVIDSVKLP